MRPAGLRTHSQHCNQPRFPALHTQPATLKSFAVPSHSTSVRALSCHQLNTLCLTLHSLMPNYCIKNPSTVLALGTAQAKHSRKAAISDIATAQTGIPVWEGWSQLKQLAQHAGKRVQLQANSKCSAQPHGLVAKSHNTLRSAHRPDPPQGERFTARGNPRNKHRTCAADCSEAVQKLREPCPATPSQYLLFCGSDRSSCRTTMSLLSPFNASSSQSLFTHAAPEEGPLANRADLQSAFKDRRGTEEQGLC